MKSIKRFFRRNFLLFILLGTVFNALGQNTRPDSTASKPDSIVYKQILPTDSAAKKSNNTGLNSEIRYSAEDSIVTDQINKIIYLYGKGRIIYEGFELDADYIRLEQTTNLIFARGSVDSKTKRYQGRPIFKQGNEPPVTTDSLLFNYQTKKGKTFGTFSEVDGGFIQAGQLKKNQYNEAFLRNAIYSTCNLEHPHFGIHITKGIVTEKQIVTGLAYLVIEDVPIPLGVPFGFFPKTNRRASGILFPSFGEDAVRGFFMRDLGYYIGLNDYWDLTLRGSLYSKGSYEGSSDIRYRKNYKYDGQFTFRYASIRTGIEGTPGYKPNKEFNVTWNHSQRPEANPGTTFSAAVNVGTSRYYQTTGANGTYNVDQLTRNQTNSSISYGKMFGNGLFNFTSSLSHNQNFQTKDINLDLPRFNLSMNTINPFDSKNRTGEQKWYQRLTFGYSLEGSNTITTKENLLFKQGSIDKFTNGLRHNITTSMSLNVLKYLQFNTSVPYAESWYFKTIREKYDAATNVISKDTVPGFARAYEYSFSSGFSTKVYGMANFKKGKLVAIRHVFTPSITANYRPDFGQDKYGFFRDLNTADGVRRYSIFEDAIYTKPSAGRSASLGFSMDNTIEAKVKSKRDSANAFQKIPILQGLTFAGNYNFVADSFKLSTISFSGRTAFFKQKLGINFNGSFDPYAINAAGNRINTFSIKGGPIARLTNIGLSTSYSFNSAAAKSRNDKLDQLDQNKANMTPAQAEQLARISSDPNAFVDFKIPWNVSASYSFNYSKNGLVSSVTNTVNFSGDFNVTSKWKVQYTSGYDFKANKLSLTQLSIYRDLHCWDMNFSWVPFGTYRSYSVNLRVRASVLQDLKLSRRSDYYNNL